MGLPDGACNHLGRRVTILHPSSLSSGQLAHGVTHRREGAGPCAGLASVLALMERQGLRDKGEADMSRHCAHCGLICESSGAKVLSAQLRSPVSASPGQAGQDPHGALAL